MAGHGPNAVILLPGNNCSGAIFEHLLSYVRAIDPINDAYTFYAFDYRGSGLSSYRHKISSLEDFARDFDEIVQRDGRLSRGHITLVGYSMGFGGRPGDGLPRSHQVRLPRLPGGDRDEGGAGFLQRDHRWHGSGDGEDLQPGRLGRFPTGGGLPAAFLAGGGPFVREREADVGYARLQRHPQVQPLDLDAPGAGFHGQSFLPQGVGRCAYGPVHARIPLRVPHVQRDLGSAWAHEQRRDRGGDPREREDHGLGREEGALGESEVGLPQLARRSRGDGRHLPEHQIRPQGGRSARRCGVDRAGPRLRPRIPHRPSSAGTEDHHRFYRREGKDHGG
ncbi:hypothetical protein DRJ27_06085 [Candidatus Acetothermia bacterium]|nr:MAG: hypothetical protein DRJ27_06085 [Candidatus Acetothermia bacterium]